MSEHLNPKKRTFTGASEKSADGSHVTPLDQAFVDAMGETTTPIVTSSSLAYALSKGIQLDEIGEITGLTPSEIASSDGLTRDDVPPRLMRTILDRGLSSAPSIEMAETNPSPFWGGLESAAFYAPTPLEALNLVTKHSDMIGTRLKIRSESSKSYTSFHFSHPLDAWDNGLIHEVGLLKTWWLIRHLLGRNARLSDVSLGFSSNATAAAYQDAFGVPTVFGQFPAEHTLVFRTDTLLTESVMADPNLFNLGRIYIEQLKRHREKRSVSRQMQHLHWAVSVCVARNLADVHSIAKAANMSVRSAQRLAARHHTTLTKMVNGARLERAQMIFLSDRKVSIATLAHELGYADERSLSKAFRRQTGLSPTQYRRMIQS